SRCASSAGGGAPGSVCSFPTRRSSDLDVVDAVDVGVVARPYHQAVVALYSHHAACATRQWQRKIAEAGKQLQHRFVGADGEQIRSEEHTSELQSRFDLVCRLLLDKTKW